MEEEIWKDIPGYEGIYQASSFGRIKSVSGKTTESVRHGTRHWKERILKPKGCKDYRRIGYRVNLWKDKKPKDFLVARLVCTTFHENWIGTKMTVNHKDGNRLNNRIENLEWLSRGDNARHAFETCIQPQNKVRLINISDGREEHFRSESCASRFLGRNNGYVSNRMNAGYTTVSSKDGVVYVCFTARDKGKHYGEKAATETYSLEL